MLRNVDGPSWIEYNHGAGRVIVTTLTYCTEGQADTTGPPLDNLLKYGRFFDGGAQTPAATFTPTATPTPTETLPPGSTTPTPERTRTRTEGPSICAGDCNDDGKVTVDELIRGVNIALGNSHVDNCPAFDPDDTGTVTIDELVRGVNHALAACPA